MDDWLWHYRGLDFGADTEYGNVAIQGLFGLPDVESSSVKRAGSHGYEPGRQLAGKRTGTIEIEYGNAEATDVVLFAARDELLRAFQPLDHEEPLVFKVPGQVERRLLCRVVKLDADVTESWNVGYGQFAVQVEAESDPFWRAATERSAVGGAQVPSIGRSYPRVHPWMYGTLSQDSTIFANNDGNVGAHWTARIDGPCVNPRLTLHGPAGVERVALDVSVSASQFLLLDSRRETILAMGTTPQYHTLAVGSEWFEVPPGMSQIKFSSADAQGEAEFRWRDSWW